MFIYGVHNPKVENAESIHDFLLDIYPELKHPIYVFNNYHALIPYMEQGLPDGAFYNQSGQYIDYHSEESDCNAEVGTFIDNIEKLTHLTAETEAAPLDSLLIHLVDAKTGKTIQRREEYEGYIVLYWAKFIGKKLNKSKTVKWLKSYDKLSDEIKKRYKLLLVNLDFQSFWDISPKDLPKL